MTARRRRGGRDDGQLLAETPVVFALALVALFLCLQGLTWAASALLARHAAFEGARVAATDPQDVPQAVRAVLPAGWRATAAAAAAGGGAVRVDVVGPVLLPGLTDVLTVSASAPVLAEPR